MPRWMYIVAVAFLSSCQGGGSKTDETEQTKQAKTVEGSKLAPGPVTMPDGDTPVADLVAAINSYDRVSLDEVRRATESCKLLGKRADSSSLAAILSVATKMLEPTDTGNAVRQACIFALAGFRGPKVTDTLLAIARADTAVQPLVIHGAAIETLGRMGFVDAIGPIIELMVAQPRLGDSARAALASLGDGAIAPLTANLVSPPPEGSSGTVKFHAARTLGDLRAVDAVPQLLASLAEPAEPAMFSRSGEFGPTHHVAVIEALQKIAGEEAAEPLRAYWRASDDDSLRTLALDAYGWVTRTSVAHAELIALLGDGAALPQIRTAAGLAYARTVYEKTQLGALTAAANKALAGDESERKWHRVMAGLIARANVGASCGANAACYQAILAKSDEQLVADAVAAIPQADKLSDSDRAILHAPARERALLELAKLGRASAPAVDAILEVAKRDDRLVRLAALRALVAAADRPCSKCSDALTAIADATPEKSVPAQLAVDTDAAASYFRAR